MASAFSGHLLQTFNNASAQHSTPNIVTGGAMTFDVRAHGTSTPSMTPFFPTSPTPFGFHPLSEGGTTAQQIATLQVKLNKKLGPEYISQRPGPGGGPKLTYAEGWKVINLANEVFGFNGWSSSIVSITTDFIDHNDTSKRFDIGVTAILRVTLRDGAYHEDVGYGMIENVKSKAAGLDKCKKEAITDSLKRTLRNFGNLLGNCLYDKAYAQEVVKIKVPPARFDKSELYRRPEFEERAPATPKPPGDHGVSSESSTHEELHVKVEEARQPESPIPHVPRHLHQDMATSPRTQGLTSRPVTPSHKTPTLPGAHTLAPGSGAINTPAQRRPLPADGPKPSGLATPAQTPMLPPRPPPPRPPPSRVIATSPLAHAHSAPEHSDSSDSTPMVARASSASDTGNTNTLQVPGNGDEDEDLFPFSTQDGALFASVDLGDGDLGRPIDYGEGLDGASMVDDDADAPVLAPDPANAAEPPTVAPPPRVRDHSWSISSSSGEPRAADKRTPTTNAMSTLSKPPTKAPVPTLAHGHGNAHPSPGAGKDQQQGPSPQPQTTSNTCAQEGKDPRCTPTPMGRFNLPADAMQQQRHVPKPAMPPNANGLKRKADMVQSNSMRPPPIQGIGLAQRQQQQQQIRGLSDNHEGNDFKRIKR